MKNNFLRLALRSSATAFLLLSILTTSSMITLAGSASGKLSGELIISGDGAVTVDGERAVSGRSVYSGSNVTTGETGAVISLGKAGRLELAPNTSLDLNLSDKDISANLVAGQVKVFNSAGVNTKINTRDEIVTGDTNQNNAFAVDVQSGATKAFAETGAAYLNKAKTAASNSRDDVDLSNKDVLVPVLVFAGITAAAVIYVLTRDKGTVNVISPVR
jgi:hypothetical protein